MERAPDGELTSGGRGVDERTRPVELPARLVERVEARVDGTDFASAGDYVAFVLEEALARVAESDGTDTVGDEERVERVSDAQVRSRLESLGYLE